MAVEAGDILLVTLVGVLEEQQILNTFHYGVSGISGAPSQVAFGTEVFAKLNAAGELFEKFFDCCPPAYHCTYAWVQFLAPVRYQKQIFEVDVVGQFAKNANTANAASVITRRGALANKHNVGSLHIPYPNLDDAASNGVISDALKNPLDLLCAKVKFEYTLATLGQIQPILWDGDGTASAVPITSAITQTTIRTMRRRTVGRGS